jgi:gluconate kinase
MKIKDRSEDYEELNLPWDRSIDTPQYREAYRDLMRTSKQTRESGLTYLSFLSRMKKRNIERRKHEFMKRRLVIDERTAPMTCEIMKGLYNGWRK